MVQSCVVVGCTNRWEKGSKISWHRIPSEKDAERRKKWLIAINRKNWVPNNQDRVCGKHFISGSASVKLEDPDYVPSLYLGYQCHTSSTPATKIGRLARIKGRRCKRLALEQDENDAEAAASILLDLSSSFRCTNLSDIENIDADSEVTPPRTKSCNDCVVSSEEVEQLRQEKLALMQELAALQEEKRKLQNDVAENTFGTQSIARNNPDEKISFFTGLPNFQTFMWIVTLVETCLPGFVSISADNIVLLVLMKVRMNLQNFDLAIRFNISRTTVSEVLNKCIPIIAKKIKFLVHWPEKEDVMRTLPKVFKPKYRNARAIIDCTEIFIERPGNLTARAATWSNYKHHNTIKYLVSITPSGAISYISRAFGGRTSDKVVTQRSGFLELLENGDLILADRGFLISEEITARNCYLAIPAFMKGQTQLTQQQVETSRHMSRVRIHVERAIGRLKCYKILSTQMSLSMVPHSDNILTICSALCNLQPKLVK